MNIQEITKEVAASFPSFGGDQNPNGNPIAIAMQGERPQFAAGVDIESVVRFVLERSGIGRN